MPLKTELKEFPELSYHAFQHPKDSQATAALRKVPGLPKALQYISEKSIEKEMLHQSISSRLQISSKQYPSIYKQFVKMAQVLDVRRLPSLYIETTPTINAFAMGMENYSIVLCSGLIDIMTEEELMAILGHELGHVKCEHQLYKTLAYFMSNFGVAILSQAKIPGIEFILNAGRMGIEYALADWSRKAELSCDRAALLATQDIDTVSSALTKLAGFSKRYADELNIDAVEEQADFYEDLQNVSLLVKLIKIQTLATQTHPDAVIRVKEIRRWAKSDEYHQIINGQYKKLGAPINNVEMQKIILETPRGKRCPSVKCNYPCVEDSTFCPSCGINVRGGQLICGKCNLDVDYEWAACLNCGNWLSAQPKGFIENY